MAYVCARWQVGAGKGPRSLLAGPSVCASAPPYRLHGGHGHELPEDEDLAVRQSLRVGGEGVEWRCLCVCADVYCVRPNPSQVWS